MSRTLKLVSAVLAAVLAPSMVTAQINFPKTDYYLGMGDSWAAGEGAIPVTNGYVYRLYDHGVFGQKQQTDFADIGMRGARTWELLQHQVPQALCTEPAQRPTVVTITAGGNDFLEGDVNVPAIAGRVVQAIHLLLNNDDPVYVTTPVIDPVRVEPCRALSNVTILVGNYLRIPHPVPAIAAQLDAALMGYDQALRFLLATQLHVPDGSRVVVVDTYTPSVGRDNLVTISRRFGYSGPFDFDFHPTNYGHAFIAQQFAEAWNALQ
jgi:GDSL-like Lipase/Acylhydrolase family